MPESGSTRGNFSKPFTSRYQALNLEPATHVGLTPFIQQCVHFIYQFNMNLKSELFDTCSKKSVPITEASCTSFAPDFTNLRFTDVVMSWPDSQLILHHKEW